MTYAFTESGETFVELQERVLANSFNPTRYRELTKAFLNEGVEKVCRRLGIYGAAGIYSYDASGVVAQPTSPFFRVDGIWTAPDDATGTTEAAVRTWGRWQLSPLRDRQPAAETTGTPGWYTAKRATDGARYAPLRIVLHPASAAGKVAIVGLTRPAVMFDDADTPGLSDDLVTPIIAYAKARCFENEDDAQMAVYWDNRFELSLREQATPDIDDQPDVVPGTWGD